MLTILTRSSKLSTNTLISEELTRRNISFQFFNPFNENSTNFDPGEIILHRTSGVLFDDLDLTLGENWQEMNKKVFNNPKSIKNIRDKDRQMLYLQKAGFSPLPFLILRGQELNPFKYFNTDSILLKSTRSNQGQGQYTFKSFQQFEFFWHQQIEKNDQRFIINPLIESFREFRVFIIGNNIEAIIEKKSTTTLPRSAQNSEFEKGDLSTKTQDLCLEIHHYFKMDYSAIDLIYYNKQFFILEINSTPGWYELEKYLNIQITKKLINYLLS